MINQLNLQRMLIAAGYRPWLDTHTTPAEKVPEYLESTMKAFAFWFTWTSLAPPQTSIVTIMQLSHEVNWVKRAICDLRNTRLTIDSAVVYHFLHFSSNFPQIPGCPSLHCESIKKCVHTIIRYWHQNNPSDLKRPTDSMTHESFVYKI